jgi:calcineurin-like phosphoesterase family protein
MDSEGKNYSFSRNYFFLCHYPTITANYDDDKPWAKHLICLYGHTHQNNKFYCIDKGNYYEGKVAQYNPYMYNVGLDAHDNKPVELQEILNDIKEAKIKLDNKIFFC